MKEQEICTMQAEAGISFAEARENVNAKYNHATSQQTQNLIPSTFNPIQRTIPNQTRSSTPLINRNLTPKNYTERTVYNPTNIYNKSQYLHSNINSITEFPPIPGLQSAPQTSNCTGNPQSHQHANVEPISSQDSVWFTQQNTHNTTHHDIVPPSQLSLPPLTQQPLVTNKVMHPNTTEHINSQIPPSSHQQTYQSSQQSHNIEDANANNTPQSFINMLTPLIPKLLPLIIRLLFSKSTSEKIECLINIGQIFQVDSIVTAALSSLDISPPSTQN